MNTGQRNTLCNHTTDSKGENCPLENGDYILPYTLHTCTYTCILTSSKPCCTVSFPLFIICSKSINTLGISGYSIFFLKKGTKHFCLWSSFFYLKSKVIRGLYDSGQLERISCSPGERRTYLHFGQLQVDLKHLKRPNLFHGSQELIDTRTPVTWPSPAPPMPC